MSDPSFAAVDLSYGCHAGRFEFPEDPSPVVIAGPNGSGKSTLLEALLRTLFGFNRRLAADSDTLQHREPWSGRAMEAEVELRATGGDRISVRRDFATNEIEVRSLSGGGAVLLRGEANPGGTGSTLVAYRDLLEEWLGFRELMPYRKTAWIGQGELLETELDEELLRAASGGHARVQEATEAVHERYKELTVEPITAGEGRTRRADRRLEKLRQELAAARERLEESERAERERQPLLSRQSELEQSLRGLDAQMEQLERAIGPLSERRAVEAELAGERSRLRRLEDSERELGRAIPDFERAHAEFEEADRGPRYPEDFDTRLAALEVLWKKRDETEGAVEEARRETQALRRPWSPLFPIAVAGAVTAGLAGTLLVMAGRQTGWPVLLVGLMLGVLAWRTRDAARRCDAAGARLERLEGAANSAAAAVRAEMAGIPDADTLGPETLPDRRRSFQDQRRRARQFEEAVLRLRDAVARAGDTLDAERRWEEPSRTPGAPPRTGPDAPAVVAVRSDISSLAESRLAELAEATSEARQTLATLTVRLERPQEALGGLPPGVEPSLEAVEAARERRRADRRRVDEELRQVRLRLAQAERDREDLVTLEQDCERLRAQIGSLEDEVLVHRLAFALLHDGFSEFRSRDQERMRDAVSTRLRALSGGQLELSDAGETLAEAQVRLAERRLPLTSPPLSFGQKHLVLFAIRLGAADFLAQESVRHPLLIDEPFTHLDEQRAREVWRLLQAIARERQVIVATQDRLVLDHLGVEPDIPLGA